MALSNSQYEAIQKKYERTRDNHRYTQELRREEVYRAIPKYRQLADSVSSLSVAGARKMLEGDEAALPELRKQLAGISARQKQLLVEAGFAPDYLEPIYTCPDCQDTGYLTGADGLKEKCHCFRQQEINLLYAQSHIQDTLGRENFSTLSYQYYKGEDLQRFRTAVDFSLEFVQNFKQDYHNLFFYGTVGTGKSFLSGCIANELLKNGCSVIYFSASGLFDTLARYAFDSRAREEQHEFCEDIHSCDLLIIDDLGTEVTNSFVSSQLFVCLNERLLRRKSTIISTNLTLEEFRDRYSDRIFSRITSGFTLRKLTGPDIRIYKKCQTETGTSMTDTNQ